MDNMFLGAENFNQNIDSWNVANVTNMYGMFGGAKNFNQNIGSWNVANVTDMRYMFIGAENFNQNISSWNFEKVTNMLRMFKGVTLSTANYDELLISLHNQSLQSNVEFDVGDNQYSAAAASSRSFLETTFNWRISDGGQI